MHSSLNKLVPTERWGIRVKGFIQSVANKLIYGVTSQLSPTTLTIHLLKNTYTIPMIGEHASADQNRILTDEGWLHMIASENYMQIRGTSDKKKYLDFNMTWSRISKLNRTTQIMSVCEHFISNSLRHIQAVLEVHHNHCCPRLTFTEHSRVTQPSGG